MTLKWIWVEDVVGARPSEPIICPYCKLIYGEHNEMVLRKSILSTSVELNNKNKVIDLYFKCPKCEHVIPFGIPVSREHFNKVAELRRRRGIGRIYAPVDEWLKNEEIKKRLRELGYF